jgi:hypothetical protein
LNKQFNRKERGEHREAQTGEILRLFTRLVNVPAFATLPLCNLCDLCGWLNCRFWADSSAARHEAGGGVSRPPFIRQW